MSVPAGLLIPAAVGCGLGLAVLGPVASACRRAGWTDPPGGHKSHAEPVPFGGVLFVLPVWWLLWQAGQPRAFAAGGLILALGLAEDLMKSRGREIAWPLRLGGFAAALLLLLGRPEFGTAPLGVQGVLALLLLLAAVISFNWLDHADGLCAAAGLGALTALALLPGGQGAGPGPPFGAAVGVLAAFLLANGILGTRAPLYLGDAGAQLLGFSVVALALGRGAAGGGPQLGAGLAAGLIPLADAVRVTVLRLAGGQPPWRPDRRRHLGQLGWARRLARGLLPGAVLAAACALALAV